MALSSFYPPLASFASNALKSRGRALEEAPSPTRTDFHRDRDRVLHSSAFRRLKGKTQVFFAPQNDLMRTRLTHTLEVAQIARSLARGLGLDEDLSETIALAHDLGHPPFGHSGEDVLHKLLLNEGGFEHNIQTFRIVTSLEKRYAAFDGLNLTWEVLEGIAKHNAPLFAPYHSVFTKHAQDLKLSTMPSLEAQAAAVADDIAYSSHDIDDGLRAGLLTFAQLEEPFLTRSLLKEIPKGLDLSRQTHELVRRIITVLVEDVLEETSRNLRVLKPLNDDDIRGADKLLLNFSPAMKKHLKELKDFMFIHLYRHKSIIEKRVEAEKTLETLFNTLLAKPSLLPIDWQAELVSKNIKRVIGDYIAGMTDDYAHLELARIATI